MAWQPIALPYEPKAVEWAHAQAVKFAAELSQSQTAHGEFSWCGWLAEAAISEWLSVHGMRHEWNHSEPSGKPDFVRGGVRIDVKTQETGYEPRADFSVHVIAERVNRIAVDWFLFAFFHSPTARLWLCGAVMKEDFVARAGAPLQPGESFPRGGTVTTNAVYNVKGLDWLTPPIEWRKGFADVL